MLNVNALSGFGASSDAPVTPASLSYIGLSSDNTASSTPSYSGVSIGAADSTRRVFAVVHWGVTNAARTLSSATIGGVAATIHAQTTTGPTSAQNDTGVAIFSALVPTGTTATVAMTFSGSVTRSQLAIYSMLNPINTTPHATMTDNTMSSGVMSGTINIPTVGMLIAATTAAALSGMTNSWVGATENYDTAHPNAAGQCATGASGTGMTLESNRTVSSTTTSTPVRGALAAVSWA